MSVCTWTLETLYIEKIVLRFCVLARPVHCVAIEYRRSRAMSRALLLTAAATRGSASGSGRAGKMYQQVKRYLQVQAEGLKLTHAARDVWGGLDRSGFFVSQLHLLRAKDRQGVVARLVWGGSRSDCRLGRSGLGVLSLMPCRRKSRR